VRDEKKFKTAVLFAFALCLLVIAYNVAGEYFIPEIEGYLRRRIYYERVISKKGLSMHNALYWREKRE